MAQALVVTETMGLLVDYMGRGLKNDPSLDTLLSLSQALNTSLFWFERCFKTPAEIAQEAHEAMEAQEAADRKAWEAQEAEDVKSWL
jgi:hypothetical protein